MGRRKEERNECGKKHSGHEKCPVNLNVKSHSIWSSHVSLFLQTPRWLQLACFLFWVLRVVVGNRKWTDPEFCQTSRLLRSFPVNKLFLSVNSKCSNQLFLLRRTPLFLLLWTSTVLICCEFNCSYLPRTQLFFIRRTSTVWTRSVLINCSLFVELQLLLLWTSTVLIVELQLFFIRRTSTVFYSSNFNCSYCVEHQLFLLRRIQLFLFTWLYPVSRVYTTLSTLDSALLCKSEYRCSFESCDYACLIL